MKRMTNLGICGLLFAFMMSSIYACSCLECTIPPVETPTHSSFGIGVGYRYLNQDQPRAGTSKVAIGAISRHHDEVYTTQQSWNLSGYYRATPTWKLRLNLPYTHRTHQQIHHHHGEKLVEGWDFQGWGDLEVFSDYRTENFELTLGVKLPTGKTNGANDEGVLAEENIQIGSGSVDYTLGLSSYWGTEIMPITFGVSYTFAGNGTHNWRAGDVWTLRSGLSYRLNSNLTLLSDVQALFQYVSTEGDSDINAADTGGTWVYWLPGAIYQLTPTLSWSGRIQIPVYEKANGIQLTPSWGLQTGIILAL